MQGYYALLFAMTLVLAIPIFYLKEIKCKPKVRTLRDKDDLSF